jgi:hypothetical protein
MAEVPQNSDSDFVVLFPFIIPPLPPFLRVSKAFVGQMRAFRATIGRNSGTAIVNKPLRFPQFTGTLPLLFLLCLSHNVLYKNDRVLPKGH